MNAARVNFLGQVGDVGQITFHDFDIFCLNIKLAVAVSLGLPGHIVPPNEVMWVQIWQVSKSNCI